jgi:threonine/homoserine/homoserine lactone efflux protein
MIEAIGKGIALGLILSILIGPSFFLLIDTSISRGFKKAIVMDLGILLSDALLIAILFFGAANQLHKYIDSPYLHLAGGLIFIGFGMSSFIASWSNIQLSAGFKTQFSRGFLVNTMNPSVIVFWLTSVTLVTAEYKSDKINILIFFVCTLFTTFSTDIIKILTAAKIKKYINKNYITRFKVITGIIMLGFGIYLIYKFAKL